MNTKKSLRKAALWTACCLSLNFGIASHGFAASADLLLDAELNHDLASLEPGDEVKLTSEVRNLSATAITGQVTYAVEYPPEFQYIRHDLNGWVCASADRRMVCNKTDLPASSEPITFVLTLRKNRQVAYDSSITAKVSTADTFDPDQDNNKAIFPVSGIEGPVKACALASSNSGYLCTWPEAPLTVIKGDTLDLRIHVQAKPDLLIDSVRLRLWLPNAFTLGAGSSALFDCNTTDNHLDCRSKHSIAPGQASVISLPLTIPGPDPRPDWRYFTASVRVLAQIDDNVSSYRRIPVTSRILSPAAEQNHPPAIFPDQSFTLNNWADADGFSPFLYVEDSDLNGIQFTVRDQISGRSLDSMLVVNDQKRDSWSIAQLGIIDYRALAEFGAGKASLKLLVTATDDHATNPLQSSAVITLKLPTEPLQAPVFSGLYNFNVATSPLTDGQAIGTINAGGSKPISLSITAGNKMITLSGSEASTPLFTLSGTQLIVVNAEAFKSMAEDQVTLTISASNLAGTSSRNYTITRSSSGGETGGSGANKSGSGGGGALVWLHLLALIGISIRRRR